MQGENIFVLGGEVHGSNTDAVDILVLKNSALVLQPSQVLVENLHGQEVSPGSALERSANFDHPVGHLGSVLLCYFVSADWVWNGLVVLEGRRMLSVHLENIVEDLSLLLTAVQIVDSLLRVLSRLDLLVQILTEIDESELLVLRFQRSHRDIDL